MKRIGSTLVLQRRLVHGLVLVTVMLAFAGQVQAGLDGLPVEPGEPAAPPQADSIGKTVDLVVRQSQDRVDNTVAEAQVVLDDVQTKASDALQPVQDALQDAQRDVENLLAPTPEEADEPRTAATPNTKAAVPAGSHLYAPAILLGSAAAGLGFLLWFLGQTATVGAGAAGTAAANDGRRFLPYASPLFTRFEKDTVLGHPKREALYGAIVGKPGVTLQDLCEQSGLSRTAVTHHLRLLEQQHLIVSKRVGRSRHFFENGGRYGRDQKEAYAVLHNDRTKDIAEYIKANPGAIQKDLCAKFDIQASVAHWHVKRLLEANLVESIRDGRTVSYFPSADVAAPAYA